ncbi:MAG: pilus assembly protein TadG-related protein, partial [Anaerolineae bacterium]|nr:pilus assembly protein TadG-related protein [Anaerolineae bacterium]
MTNKNSEKGQALVLIALAAVGLFAFAALAIDGGRVFSDRRHAQNAADTAALAAALAKIRAEP